MMKKISCLLLSLIMVMQISTAVFAGSYEDHIVTTGKLQITESGKAFTDTTGNTVSFVKRDTDAFPKVDYLCTLDMAEVRSKFTEWYEAGAVIAEAGYSDYKKDDLAKRLSEMEVKGEFTIEITYPKSLNVPNDFITKEDEMYGFNDGAKLIFGEDKRTLTTGETENTLKITLKVVGLEDAGTHTRPGYVKAKDLLDNLDTYLCDLTLKCEGVETTEYGSFKVTGKMTGVTNVVGRSTRLDIDYKTNPEIVDATCNVSRPSGGGSLGGNPTYTITFDVDGDTDLVAPVRKSGGTLLRVSEMKMPYKDGYAFDGWYSDSELTQKVTESITVNKNMTFYGTWKKSTSAGKLNNVDHMAYVAGYPDGTVKPLSNITREEIATIFFRLLTDEVRNPIMSKTNSFNDMTADRWSNTAISTMEKGGFIHGYTDGSFAPSNNITRAEFATIASSLDDMTENVTHGFSDISGHWAEKYIADAVAKGWLAGYEDGTFRPEQNITRAEAMTIINRMLNRFVNKEGLHEDAAVWPDNSEGTWYYYAVEEATNSHDYERQSDGVYEKWTKINPNTDWSKLGN